MQGVPMDARRTGERIGWWFGRGSLFLTIALAGALYAAVVVRAELSLPLDVQLALFESQRGMLWADGQVVPDALTLQVAASALAVQQHLP